MVPDPSLLLELKNWSLVRRQAGAEIPLLVDIDLRIPTGRWLAVLGANGSGKSSLLKFLASEDSPLKQDAAIMFQDPDDQIIASTVERELTLGRENLQTDKILEEFGLAGQNDLDPRLLSAGQKQRLVLAVSLAGNPEVLLADEPTALQDSRQSGWILEHLHSWMQQSGHTLITATCDWREAAMADDLLVLEKGRILLHGPARELLTDPAVKALIGCSEETVPEPEKYSFSDTTEEPVLLVEKLSCRFRSSGPGFYLEHLALQPGSRLGITGSNGCGKSTLLAALAGARKPENGQIFLDRHRLYESQSLDLDHGLSMLAPQFPEYLFTRETVAREIAVDPALQSMAADHFLQKLGMDPALAGRNPHSLSTGQRRRLALGMVLFSRRRVLLLDEPTAALDLKGKQRVLKLLEELPGGEVLILASHDRDFLSAAGCMVLNLDDHQINS